MLKKESYNKTELTDFADGKYGNDSAKLPLAPMLMVDRIKKITDKGGKFGKGLILAEMDVNPKKWFFECHFEGDPVMPGCLGLDALWQLTGFNLGWREMKGKGRALGVGEVKFTGMVTPEIKLVRYEVNFTRVIDRKLKLALANGTMYADNEKIYSAENMKVGLFQS